MANDSTLLQQRRKRAMLLHRLKWLAILGVILACLGLAARPAYRIFRDYRINKNLQAAQEAARLEDWASARDKARSVLLVRRDDLDAFRIWCRALAEQKEPRAYVAAWYRFRDRRATEQDRLEALRVLAVQSPHALGIRAYNSMSDTQRRRADVVAVITPLLVRIGKAPTAEDLLRKTMGDTPSAAVSLELIRAICEGGNLAALGDARLHFSRLVTQNSSKEGLEALEILGRTPGGLAPGSPLPDNLPEWVKRQPKAQTIHHLLALHPAIAERPDDASAVFRNAIEQFAAVDPGVLGTWLVRHNRPEDALTMLESPSMSRSDAFIARLHALLRLGRFEEMRKIIEDAPTTVDMVEVAMLRAIVARKLGNDSAAIGFWRTALDQAAFDTRENRFIEVARAAQLHGADEVAQDSWVAAIRAGWGPLPLYDSMVPLIEKLNDKSRSEDLLAIYRTIIEFEPENPEVLHNYLYLGLIHHVIPPQEVASRLNKMTEAYPKNSAIAASLAMAELMNNQPEKAQALIPVVNQSKLVTPQIKQILEGATMVLNGKADEGEKLLLSAPWEKTLLQERRVFRDLLAHQKDVELPKPIFVDPEDLGDPAQVPAWRKALEKMEKDRAGDILPPLPMPALASPASDEEIFSENFPLLPEER